MTSPATDPPDGPPEWFTKALAAEPETRRVDVDGTAIAYLAWGDPSQRGVVLVHGGGAHAHWWDHIGPLLALDRRVLALDLSGHGDSGRREDYSLDIWAREILAVAADAGLTEPPTVIGHSMGGLATLRLASLHGEQIAGAVIIDSPVRDRDLTPEETAARERRAFGPLRIYPTREDCLAHFRPVPLQPTLPWISHHVAATSVRPVAASPEHPDGGWTWKFDRRIFAREPFGAALLTRLDCRVALFRAEHGIVSVQMSQVMYDRLGRVAPVIEIPAAGHHVMLDQPVALIAALRTLLSDWDHSRPAPNLYIEGLVPAPAPPGVPAARAAQVPVPGAGTPIGLG
jgi:pimeloyl-ACP methyl ester carboxylesterase